MRPDVIGPDAPKESRIMLKALGEAFTIITLNDVSSTVVSMDGIMINRSPGIGLNAAQTLKSNIRQTLLAQARPHQMPKNEHRSKTRPTHCSNRIDRPSEHVPAGRLGTVPAGRLNTVKLAAKNGSKHLSFEHYFSVKASFNASDKKTMPDTRFSQT